MTKKNRSLFIAVFASAAAAAALAAFSVNAQNSRLRTIELEETVRVTVPPGSTGIRLWIPKIPNGKAQSVKLTGIESPVPYKTTSDSEFGNETFFFRFRRFKEPSFEIKLLYRVTRRQQSLITDAGKPLELDSKPRGLLVINDEIRKIAQETTKGLSDPMEKSRALYRHVLSRMAYDKTGEGWGRGDSVYACEVGKGNCTDFHSLFMALAIAGGIPSRFQMGFSVPQSPEGEITGYHCWAEFYAEGKGWMPVDISEAWKNPKRKKYYFGRLDPSRVLVSQGREIQLSPAQKGPRLNFLHRPYAEADGKPLEDIEFYRRYKEIPEPS